MNWECRSPKFYGGISGNTWAGVSCLKNPLDAWMYQEMVWRSRPEWIIETGTNAGGSAAMFAGFQRALEVGKGVITVELSQHDWRPDSRIYYLVGDSAHPYIIQQIQELVKGEQTLVSLDSGHDFETVRNELELYQQFVLPGGFMVAEDSDCQEAVWRATQEFLARHPEEWMVIDEWDKRFESMTCSQGCVLERTSQ